MLCSFPAGVHTKVSLPGAIKGWMPIDIGCLKGPLGGKENAVRACCPLLDFPPKRDWLRQLVNVCQ